MLTHFKIIYIHLSRKCLFRSADSEESQTQAFKKQESGTTAKARIHWPDHLVHGFRCEDQGKLGNVQLYDGKCNC